MTAAFPLAWPRSGLLLAWGGVAASLALAPLLAGAPVWVLALPWAASVLVLGLPHGAADPFVPFAMDGRPASWGGLALFCAAYLGVGAAYLALWHAAPVAAAVGFVLLTWAHWGQGDVFALRGLGWDDHLTTAPQRALAAAVRGALPMLVPLAAFPAVYADVVGAMAGAVRGGSAEAARALVLGLPSAAVWTGFGALVASYAAWGALRARGRGAARRTLARDLSEVGGLTLFFAVVPPLWSVGVYFSLWHGFRHLARLAPAVAQGSARRLALLCVPFTLGALALMALLAARVTPGATADPAGQVGAYLVGIAALTLPHVLVVSWMDVRQRVWTAAARAPER